MAGSVKWVVDLVPFFCSNGDHVISLEENITELFGGVGVTGVLDIAPTLTHEPDLTPFEVTLITDSLSGLDD